MVQKEQQATPVAVTNRSDKARNQTFDENVALHQKPGMPAHSKAHRRFGLLGRSRHFARCVRRVHTGLLQAIDSYRSRIAEFAL